MLNLDEIRLTDEEATSAAYGRDGKRSLNPVALRKRRQVADAQLSKCLWNIVDQLRTHGAGGGPASEEDLVGAAKLEEVALLANLPHPTTRLWFSVDQAARIYMQTADPLVALELRNKSSGSDQN
jgi:hypothetical protein